LCTFLSIAPIEDDFGSSRLGFSDLSGETGVVEFVFPFSISSGCLLGFISIVALIGGRSCA
jgi:hypothetical protein